MTKTNRELWTTTQVAAYCGVKPRTYHAYRARMGAPGPVDREPNNHGQLLFDADEVREWHAARPSSRQDTPGSDAGAE